MLKSQDLRLINKILKLPLNCQGQFYSSSLKLEESFYKHLVFLLQTTPTITFPELDATAGPTWVTKSGL